MSGTSSNARSLRAIHAGFATAAVLVVGSAGAIGVIPAHRAQVEQRTQRSELLSVNENLDTVGAVYASLEDRVAELENRIESYGYVLTSARDLNRRLSDLTRLFESQSLEIGSLQPQALVSGEKVSHIPLRIEVSGPLESLLRLLDTFEDSYPDLHIDSLTLEFSGPESLRLRMSVRWFVAPE